MRRQDPLPLRRLGWLLCVVLSVLSAPRGLVAESLPPPAGLTAPTTLTAMPAFELPNAQGDTVRSTDLQGKVVLVRFWATW
ncbi:MAG: redoxin domain-containing protein [Candidatus Tectomicrobia bacterium]|uniref:Redoxin domain-containing protein n=1 Tax=Tectimicrobiota bacterium TaxID=2528274 RepID=A0A938B297_UNCTE|nr:redoxin domain-containing protein [Candidatus Tectomicrobia bacterium]